MHYEQKQIPPGSGNFYWYRRITVNGRQRSEYVGKKAPPDLLATQKANYEADRAKTEERHQLEAEIRRLTQKLNNL